MLGVPHGYFLYTRVVFLVYVDQRGDLAAFKLQEHQPWPERRPRRRRREPLDPMFHFHKWMVLRGAARVR